MGRISKYGVDGIKIGYILGMYKLGIDEKNELVFDVEHKYIGYSWDESWV